MAETVALLRPSFVLAAAFVAASVLAQRPAAPALNSNPGALYTLYLDFSGFDYTQVVNSSGAGTWATTGKSPGVRPAYDTDGDGATFNASESQAIRDTWARFTNAYVGFNINVTTVDPSVAAGISGATTTERDANRQAYYDRTRYLQHQSIGGTYNWYASSGGVSYVGVAQSANVASGYHTNWVFPANGSGTSAKGMAAAGIHEDGHALGLGHQRDESNGGGYSNNNNAVGNGSYAPIMGTTYNSQRGTWRQGNSVAANSPAGVTNANDVAVMQSQANMGAFRDDGIGHSLDTATALAVSPNGTVNVSSTASKGFIMPKSSTGYSAGTVPNANGDADYYTTDFFKFSALGGAVSLTATDGTSMLQAGVADPGATMRCVMKILNGAGLVVGTATEDATTLVHTYTGNLSVGTYYAQILSYGAYVSAYEPNSRYFNMGGYFLTGSGIQAVPEPGAWAVLGLGALATLRRRGRSVSV